MVMVYLMFEKFDVILLLGVFAIQVGKFCKKINMFMILSREI